MAQIKKIHQNGTDIYPVTHEDAVFDNDGMSIGNKLNDLKNNLDENFIEVKDFDEVENIDYNVVDKIQNLENKTGHMIIMSDFPRLDGEETDTGRIKRAIQHSIDLFLQNGIGNHKIIEFPSGKYIIDETITVPLFIKFKSIGNVIFISKVQGPLFNIKTDSSLQLGDVIDPEPARWSLYNGNVFNGSYGGITILLDSSIDKNGTIALNIGHDSGAPGAEYFTSWCYFDNINILGFDIGINFNSYDVFIQRFNNIIITKCNKCLCFNKSNIRNSGEAITFNNCVLCNSGHCVYINNWADLELIFNACSFDFVETVLESNKAGVYRFTDCHFEGIGYTDSGTEIGENPYIIYTTGDYWNAPTVFIDGSDFMTVRGEVIRSEESSGLELFLNGLTNKASSTPKKDYALCNDNVDLVSNNFISSKYYTMIPQRKLNIKQDSCFESFELNANIYKGTTGGYTFESDNINGKTTVTDELIFKDGKSLKIVVPEGGLWTVISSEKFACRAGENILNNYFWYIQTDLTDRIGHMSIETRFFDKNGNRVTYPTTKVDPGTELNASTNNEWNRLKNMERVIVPKNAVEFQVVYIINPIKQCTLYLTEFYTYVY